MSKEETTNAPEVKEESETTVNTEEGTQDESTGASEEPSVSELHQDDSSKEEKKVPEMVPKSRLDKEIQRKKELEAELARARAEVSDPSSDTSSDDVQEIKNKLAQLEQKERQEKMNQIFDQNFNKALENNPQFEGIANKEVIRQMAFNPANKDKTYSQLLNEAYGNALQGTRTVETTIPRGGAKDTKVDIQRAQSDADYRREVFANPELKQQYNEGFIDRISRHM